MQQSKRDPVIDRQILKLLLNGIEGPEERLVRHHRVMSRFLPLFRGMNTLETESYEFKFAVSIRSRCGHTSSAVKPFLSVHIANFAKFQNHSHSTFTRRRPDITLSGWKAKRKARVGSNAFDLCGNLHPEQRTGSKRFACARFFHAKEIVLHTFYLSEHSREGFWCVFEIVL